MFFSSIVQLIERGSFAIPRSNSLTAIFTVQTQSRWAINGNIQRDTCLIHRALLSFCSLRSFTRLLQLCQVEWYPIAILLYLNLHDGVNFPQRAACLIKLFGMLLIKH